MIEPEYLFGHAVTTDNVNLSNPRLHTLRRIVYSVPLVAEERLNPWRFEHLPVARPVWTHLNRCHKGRDREWAAGAAGTKYSPA